MTDRAMVSGSVDSDLPNAPPRSTALAIIDALKTADGWPEVERLTSVPEAQPLVGVPPGGVQHVAHRCWEIYGYPELSPDALARWTAEAFERRSRSSSTTTTTTMSAVHHGETHSYGFNPAR